MNRKERRDMGHLWRRLAMFLMLVSVLPVFAVVCLYKSGELRPFSSYLHKLDEGQLLGLAHSNYDKTYKFHMTNEVLQPQVLALGSSRIMEVERSLVRPDYSFYNAGGAIQNIYELPLFVRKLQYTPEIILVNLDQWWFNPAYEVERETYSSKVFDEPVIDLPKVGNLICDFYEDWIIGKISLSQVFFSTNIGLNAICNENGFDSEGIRIHWDIVNNPQTADDYNFQNVFRRIQNGNNRFQYGQVADVTIVDAVEDFLCLCVERDIQVVAFLPPFAPLVYSRMQETGKYGYMSQIYDVLLPVFEKYDGCVLYDFTDVTDMAVRNYDFIDGFHGSQLVYNLIVKKMLEKESQMRRYFVDAKIIEELDSAYMEKKIRYHSIE